MNTQLSVRRYLVAMLLCGIFFLYPFQVYIIGSGTGIGFEGAAYRFQVTIYGNSLITIISDWRFVLQGIYSGKTALSIIIWGLGTVLLTATTIFGLIFVKNRRTDYYRQISLGLIATCVCYLLSCIAQYGFLFKGPAGTSIPVGIFLILFWVILINTYPELFSGLN
jgi:hypothetical protein